jgi:hypothetical protein
VSYDFLRPSSSSSYELESSSASVVSRLDYVGKFSFLVVAAGLADAGGRVTAGEDVVDLPLRVYC